MTGAMWLWLYVSGAIFAVFPIARYMIRDGTTTYGEPEGVELAMLVALAMLIAPFWPLLIVGYVVYLAVKPKEDPKSG